MLIARTVSKRIGDYNSPETFFLLEWVLILNMLRDVYILMG